MRQQPIKMIKMLEKRMCCTQVQLECICVYKYLGPCYAKTGLQNLKHGSTKMLNANIKTYFYGFYMKVQ